MSQPAERTITIDDLSKGIDTFSTDTQIPKGFYADAQNMVLSKRAPQTIGGLTKFNTTALPNSRITHWAEPYTDNDGNTRLLVIGLDTIGHADGHVLYQYNVGTDTWSPIVNDLDELTFPDGEITPHVPWRGRIIVARDAGIPIKWDGSIAEHVSRLIVVNMETPDALPGAWTGGVAQSADGRRKEGSQSRTLVDVTSMFYTWDDNRDFVAGLFGGTNFSDDADLCLWFRTTTTPGGTFDVTVRFGDAADANFFETDINGIASSSTWAQITAPRSAFATTGVPSWDNIEKVTIFQNTAGWINDFDWVEWRLQPELAAPVTARIFELYANQLVLGRFDTNFIQIAYSEVDTIDYFPPDQVAQFSGGRHALEKTDQITTLFAYFDELIVGKVNSSWTFSGTGANVSIGSLPLTIGIDGFRAIAETPWALHYCFEHNIFGSRLTSRGLVSTNISAILADLSNDSTSRFMALRHDRSNTVRWTLRTNAADPTDQNDLGLIYNYQLDAWSGRYTPKVRYYTKAIVDGVREILCCQYDGFVRRVDVGTTFDGTAIESYITLPWYRSESQDRDAHETKWLNGTFMVKGTASVMVEARFADDPSQFDTAVFSSYGTTPNADGGFVYFGVTNRFIQVRLRATSLAFEVTLPIVIGYSDTSRRI